MRAIPVIDVPATFAVESLRLMKVEARTLLRKATQDFWYVPKAGIRLADRTSRQFLVRSGQPHLEEIDMVAEIMGQPGVYFLNVNFEWGCTVKAYQSSRGPELVRVLDWPTPGLGKYVVMLRVQCEYGHWYTPSWPGFAGIVHGFAPGRFAIAMNQAPLTKHTGIFPLDWSIERKHVWNSKGMLPAHVLRRVMERAPDYVAACEILHSTPVCIPTIYSIVGVHEGEYSIIEASRENRFSTGLLCGANHFEYLPDGYHRGEVSPGRSSKLFRAECELDDTEFSWLKPPVMNDETVVAFVANPSQGAIMVCGFENQKRATETLTVVG